MNGLCISGWVGFAARNTGTVPLRVHSPEPEVRTEPLWMDGAVFGTSELANLVETFPRILLAFEAFGSLCLRFLELLRQRFSKTKNPPA